MSLPCSPWTKKRKRRLRRNVGESKVLGSKKWRQDRLGLGNYSIFCSYRLEQFKEFLQLYIAISKVIFLSRPIIPLKHILSDKICSGDDPPRADDRHYLKNALGE